MREGISRVKELGGESDAIKQVIFGGRAPSHNPHSISKEMTFYSQRLNGPQQDAIKFCLASNGIILAIYFFSRINFIEIALIHGPPGTGKTTTVVCTLQLSILRHNNDKVLG